MENLKKRNIYDGYEFTNEPYETNDKFSIYLPKEKDNIEELIQKSDNISENLNKKLTRSLPKFHNKANSMHESVSPNQIKFDLEKKEDELIFPKINQKNTEFNEIETESSKNQRAKSLDSKSNELKSIFKTPLKTKKEFLKLSPLKAEREKEFLRKTLYFDEKTKSIPKSVIKSQRIENLLKESDALLSNKQLLNYVYKIKKLNLLENPSLKISGLKGSGRFNYIINDYHLRETNPGYARNTLGTFFTR